MLCRTAYSFRFIYQVPYSSFPLSLLAVFLFFLSPLLFLSSSLRIVLNFNLFFLSQYFKGLGRTIRISDFSPRLGTLAAFFLCFVITKGSQHFLSGQGLKTELLHLAVGGAVGIALLGFIYLYEKRFVSEMRVLLQTRKMEEPAEKAQ